MSTPTTARRKLRHCAVAWLVAALFIAVPPVTLAAPCAGFNDVQDSNGFCPNVDWLKNRRITVGCTAATFCPGDAVIRLAMAAFMNRLGTALTPVHLPVDASPGAVDVDAGIVLCQTQDFEVEDFPRRAYADLSFNGIASGDVGLAADLVMSSTGGASWTNLNAVPNRGFVPANRWGTLSDFAVADLAVGQNVRWGVRVTRVGAPGADLSNTRCQLRVLVHSRNGTASPF